MNYYVRISGIVGMYISKELFSTLLCFMKLRYLDLLQSYKNGYNLSKKWGSKPV